jgi:cytochrome P450
MSTTETSANATSTNPTKSAPAGPAEVDRAGSGLAAASLADALAVVLTGLLPALIRGLFSPRRRAMRLLTVLDADRRAIAVLSRVKRKHGGQGVRLLGGRLVVLWGAEAIREVLDKSADVYASDAGAKAKGMSHFQPDALTLSRGAQWRDRRAFNEAILATDERIHPLAERFLAVIDDEIDRLRLGDKLEWEQWERLFDRITLRVIFGDRAGCDQRLTQLLEKLMGEANRIVGTGPSERYYEFYGELERHLRDPEPGSLIARVPGAPQSTKTRIVQQIPHWMFAMRDTLAANTYRALAAIVADPAVDVRVRQELEGADVKDPVAIDAARYLEGCLHEAMRLWPTTPLLARETTRETTLVGERLKAGTQVMLMNVFNHRDGTSVRGADSLDPERWASDQRDYRFNHLSNGTQDCPGGPLVLLLGKTVIARVLGEYSLKLEEPRLDPGEHLPHMLDFFGLRFSVERRGAR